MRWLQSFWNGRPVPVKAIAAVSAVWLTVLLAGCTKAPPPAAPAPQAMPVAVQPVIPQPCSHIGHLCGHDQEPPLGHLAAAGGWQPYEDPGQIRRSGQRWTGADGGRPAEAGGDGEGAGGNASSNSRRSTTTTRPIWPARSSSTRMASSLSRRTTRRFSRSRTRRLLWTRRGNRRIRRRSSSRTTRYAHRLRGLWVTSRCIWATTSRRQRH